MFTGAVRRSSEPIRLNGHIKTKQLIVGQVAQSSGALNRAKRDIQSLHHDSIRVKSINGVMWDDFVANIFRIGADTAIQGAVLYIIFLRCLIEALLLPVGAVTTAAQLSAN